MKIKYLLCGITALAFSAQVSAQGDDDKVVNPDSTGFKFTDVKIIKTTPVKNQNASGTCWCFSGNSFMEDEIIKKNGNEVDLSEMFAVRQCYLDKAKKFIRMNGSINFSQGGSILDVPYVMANYGAMPEEVYAGLNYGEEKHNHKELAKVLTAYMNTIATVPNKKLSKAWYQGFVGIIDAYFGKVPETFTYKGKTYTPQSYAKSLGIDMNDYQAFTSFSHHPFYQKFILEVADNWLWGEYNNVKLNELKAIVDNAIDNGYSVVWAADVSEGGFKWRKGYAIMPKEKGEKDMTDTELSRWVQISEKERNKEKFEIKGPVPEIEVTQESRQEMFDNQETTDDHGMVIVGYATDQNGTKYYKVKNSWDTNQLYKGYFYVSEPYFLAKTISILVNKNAVPSSISSKLK